MKQTKKRFLAGLSAAALALTLSPAAFPGTPGSPPPGTTTPTWPPATSSRGTRPGPSTRTGS